MMSSQIIPAIFYNNSHHIREHIAVVAWNSSSFCLIKIGGMCTFASSKFTDGYTGRLKMITRLFANASGLTNIAGRFPASPLPPEAGLSKQTVQIGAVRFRRCVTVHADAAGLYLLVRVVFSKYPAVCIPWNEMRDFRESKVYGRPAIQFSVGEPSLGTVRIPLELFEKIKTHLAPGVI
jgi:hypothetical protein